jgi:isopenicillin N synthase-like dioxygenase
VCDALLAAGYTEFGEETLSPATQSQGDTKEGLYFGREVPLDDPEAATPLHGPNQWPDPEKLPHFRTAMMDYFDACTAVGHRCETCKERMLLVSKYQARMRIVVST